MKTKFFLVLLIQLMFTQILFSAAEISIYNRSNETLKFVVYPIGAIFNGLLKYKLDCEVFSTSYAYIIGGQKSGITLNQSYLLDQDAAPTANGEASIGYGKYRIVFYKLNSGYDSVNYCDIDFSDADYPYTGHQYLTKDLTLEYNSSSNITYHFGGGSVSNSWK